LQEVLEEARLMRATIVNRRVWIEGFILVAISLVSLAESLRLISYEDPQLVTDLLGPGYYLLLMSIGMLVTGVVHIYHHRKERSMTKEETSKEMRIRLMGSFVACVIYLILINTIGYSTATFVFFVLMFRIVGIRSWPYNFVLSAFLSVVFYFVFVKFCNMIFPRGILF